ncbi:hypothetical protein ACFFX1_22330 [Dactylosporangium sucinum]|uniref:hypothetical protein n=1 Tax=Dactylosporangium sucinum TaxID=1424081 RepID=UPI00167CDBA6|nr:hypothetical protein [Dactylosporangium sucinum]
MIVAQVVATALVGVVVAYWPRIMQWSVDSLLPWVDEHLPAFAEDVRLAFQSLDNAIVDIRRAIRSAWRRVRDFLLRETADFIRLFNGRWAVQITSYLRNQAMNGKPIVKIVSQEEIDWDDLPEDVRAQVMRDELAPVDVTKIRDELTQEG